MHFITCRQKDELTASLMQSDTIEMGEGETKSTHLDSFHLKAPVSQRGDFKIAQTAVVLLTSSQSHMLILVFHPLFFFTPAKIFERHLAAFQNSHLHPFFIPLSLQACFFLETSVFYSFCP